MNNQCSGGLVKHGDEIILEMMRDMSKNEFELKSKSIRMEQRGEENLLRQSELKKTLCAISKRLEL